MFIFKIILLVLIVLASTILGILFSKQYSNREKEIKEMKSALNMFSTKIKFTYETIPNIFMEISNKIEGNIGYIFARAAERMKEDNANNAWCKSFEDINTNFKKEDITILKGLGKLLRTNRYRWTN